MRLIYIKGQGVPVSEEVYRAYWQHYERMRYQKKCQQAKECSWLGIYTQKQSALPHEAQSPSAEVIFLQKQKQKALYQALDTLPVAEKEALLALLLGETSERALAHTWGISRSAVHRWRQRQLKALRQLLKNQI